MRGQPTSVGVPSLPHPPLPMLGYKPTMSTTRAGKNEFLAAQAINSFKTYFHWLPIFLLL